MPSIVAISIGDKRVVSQQYVIDYGKYQSDSLAYWRERLDLIRTFQTSVDSLLSVYKSNLSNGTALVASVEQAERVFEVEVDSKHALLIVGDGQDSNKEHINSIAGSPCVILINAAKKTQTSLDAILTKRMQSIEDAINYSITL
jgi:hypothetical protein